MTWLYTNYVKVGSFEQGRRAFQTLNRLNQTTGLETSEEMHYAFDTSGRLRQAAFAQSSQTGTGALTSAPYYTSSYPAASRAVAFYDYDGGGRQTDLQQGWQTWGNGGYTATQCVLRNSCQYNNTWLALKADSNFLGP